MDALVAVEVGTGLAAAGVGVGTWMTWLQQERVRRARSRAGSGAGTVVRPAPHPSPVVQERWRVLLDRGDLVPVPGAGLVADPGNPGWELLLAEDRTGSLPGVRVLLALNAALTADGVREVVGLLVPDHFTDPLAAAAWTYDDPTHPLRTTREAYAATVVRT
jgi:hypothetical protein